MARRIPPRLRRSGCGRRRPDGGCGRSGAQQLRAGREGPARPAGRTPSPAFAPALPSALGSAAQVGPSEAALLNKLGKKPFNYGLVVRKVYEGGAVFDPSILAISEADLTAKFSEALGNVAALSLATGYPTQASLPYMVLNGFAEAAALGLEAGFIFEQIKKIKEMIDNPEAFASAAAAAPAAGGAAAAAAPTAAAAKAAEPEEEEEEEAGDFGLFD